MNAEIKLFIQKSVIDHVVNKAPINIKTPKYSSYSECREILKYYIADSNGIKEIKDMIKYQEKLINLYKTY